MKRTTDIPSVAGRTKGKGGGGGGGREGKENVGKKGGGEGFSHPASSLSTKSPIHVGGRGTSAFKRVFRKQKAGSAEHGKGKRRQIQNKIGRS